MTNLMICPKWRECERPCASHSKPHPFRKNGCDWGGRFCPKCIPWEGREIRYELTEIFHGKISTYTDCKHFPIYTVGGRHCRNECEHHTAIDKTRQVVCCSHPTKEKGMKYELVKTITVGKIIAENGGLSCKDLRDAIKWLCSEYMEKYHTCLAPDEHISWDWLYPLIKDNKQYIDFLIEHGFIKEVKEEVFYKVGDRFQFGSIGHYYRIKRICNLNSLALIGEGDYCFMGRIINVEDANKITEYEFKQMCNGVILTKL